MTDARQSKVVVVARCVGCFATREIKAGEVERGDVPICRSCFSPMVAESSETR